MAPPEGVRNLLDEMVALGLDPWLVGGCVRDRLLGLEPRDWDAAFAGTTGDLERLARRDPNGDRRGIDYGTLRLRAGETDFEVTLFRREGHYTDGRRPACVRFDATLEEDLGRRDYTLNALAWNVRTKQLTDLWGARNTLSREPVVIQTCSPPGESFHRDGLRILRGFVLFGRILEAGRKADWSPGLLDEALRLAPNMKNASPGVLGREMGKIWNSDRAGDVLKEMHHSGILAILLESRSGCFGEVQWDRLNRCPSGLLVQAGLLAMSGLSATTLGQCLGTDNKRVMLLEELLENRTGLLRDGGQGLARRLGLLGPEKGGLLLRLLAVLDEQAPDGDESGGGNVWYLQDLNISGHDIEALGIRGPLVGQMLWQLLEEVQTGKTINRKDRLLHRVRSLKEEYGRNKN